MNVKVGINILGLQSVVGGAMRDTIEIAVMADRKGIDVVTLGDHLGFNRGEHEVRRADYNFPFTLCEPWPEPIAFLSAVAALTERIRLSTFVLIAPLRPTLLLAKQLATLDNISRGRVTIGLGVGWQEKEFIANGMAFEGRYGDLEDMVVAMRALWSQPPAKASGRNFSFDDFYALPLPVQGRDLPILFGLKPTAKNLDRMARLSQGWALNPADRSEFVEKALELKRLGAKYGRNPESFEFEVGQGVIRNNDGTIDTEAIRAGVAASASDGATTVSFLLRDFCRTKAEIEPCLNLIASMKE